MCPSCKEIRLIENLVVKEGHIPSESTEHCSQFPTVGTCSLMDVAVSFEVKNGLLDSAGLTLHSHHDSNVDHGGSSVTVSPSVRPVERAPDAWNNLFSSVAAAL